MSICIQAIGIVFKYTTVRSTTFFFKHFPLLLLVAAVFVFGIFEMNFAGSNIIVFIFSPCCEYNVCQMFRKCLAVLQCIKMNILLLVFSLFISIEYPHPFLHWMIVATHHQWSLNFKLYVKWKKCSRFNGLMSRNGRQ